MVASLPLDTSAHVAIRKTVVVIDDGADLVESILLLLKLEGYRAYGTSDPRAGIDLAKHTRADVVVLDFQMPELDGGEVGRCLRADPCLAGMKILMSSGTPEVLVRQSFSAYDVYLAKPVLPNEFLQTVAALAGR